MKVSKEELLHIANLADLNLKEDEVDNYLANLQDILNNKKRLKEINDILGESLEEINESNSQNDIDKFKLWIDAQLSYQTEEDEDIEVGFSKDVLIDKIKEFNQETHSHLQYDEHIQEITDKLADEYNGIPNK